MKSTFNKQLSAALLITSANGIGSIIIFAAVVDDHDPLGALVLKDIPVEWIFSSTPCPKKYLTVSQKSKSILSKRGQHNFLGQPYMCSGKGAGPGSLLMQS